MTAHFDKFGNVLTSTNQVLCFEEENEICVAGTNGEGEFVGTPVDDQDYDSNFAPAPAPGSSNGGYDGYTYASAPSASAPSNYHSFMWASMFGMFLIVSLALDV